MKTVKKRNPIMKFGKYTLKYKQILYEDRYLFLYNDKFEIARFTDINCARKILINFYIDIVGKVTENFYDFFDKIVEHDTYLDRN
jgi:hypothetical protein